MSRYDLEDQLWAQLAAAAELPKHRQLGNLTAWRLRAVAPRMAIGVAVAITVLLALVAIRPFAPADDTTATSNPRVIDRIALGGSLNAAIPAFGDVWINDSSRGDLLRLDPAQRKVLARIHIPDTSGGRSFGLASADGSIWALLGGDNQSGWIGPLVRVDPKTNTVRQRIPLGSLHGLRIIAVGLVADPHQHALWIPATDGAIRIDTRTGTVDRRALAPKTHLGEISGMGPPSDPLAMIASDGNLLRLDARTGASRATIPLPFARAQVAPASGHSVLLWRPDGTIARFDTAPAEPSGNGASPRTCARRPTPPDTCGRSSRTRPSRASDSSRSIPPPEPPSPTSPCTTRAGRGRRRWLRWRDRARRVARPAWPGPRGSPTVSGGVGRRAQVLGEAPCQRVRPVAVRTGRSFRRGARAGRCARSRVRLGRARTGGGRRARGSGARVESEQVAVGGDHRQRVARRAHAGELTVVVGRSERASVDAPVRVSTRIAPSVAGIQSAC